MNLRDFKKDVEYFVGEFIDDCALFIHYNPEIATDEMADLLEEAVDLYNDMKDKAADNVEGNKRLYFNSLRKEMGEKLDNLFDKLSSIVADKK